MLRLKEYVPFCKPIARGAFTLIELIIVVTIVLILAATAISQTGSIRNLLTFNNTFEKVVFMVQRARTMALTQQGGTSAFGVEFIIFDITSNGSVARLISPGPPEIEHEKFVLPQNVLLMASHPLNPSCTSKAHLYFARTTGQAQILCDNSDLSNPSDPTSSAIRSLTIALCQLSTAGGTGGTCTPDARQKSFTIHRAAGVPQF